MSGNLILIASYPRSGNTWLRLLFERVLRGPARSINDLDSGLYGFSRRREFDALAPVNAADLLPDEIDTLLPAVVSRYASARGTTFVKVHDAARRTRDGAWLYPPDSVAAVLYLVRHPFDVAMSYAHHLGLPLARAVESMADDSEIVSASGPRLPLPLPQRMGSWSSNAASWTGDTPYRTLLIRYEDLQADPLIQFHKAVDAAGIVASADEMARAVAATAFDRVKSEEQQRGFRERPATSDAFFRAGRAGTWQGKLDEPLREKLLRDHGTVMTKLGYRPDGGADPLP